jgi:hypothetical protein
VAGGRGRGWWFRLLALLPILAVLWFILRPSPTPAPESAASEPRAEPHYEEHASASEGDLPPLERGSAAIHGRLFLEDGSPGPRGVRISLARHQHLDFSAEVGKACNCEGCEDVYLAQICGDSVPRLSGIMDRIAHERRAEAEAETDKEGRFSFDALSADTYVVWAENDTISATFSGITLAEHEERTIELRSAALGSISGFVNDQETGDHIADAQAAAMDLALGTIHEARGRPDGSFEIRGLRVGARYYVQAKAPGYGPGGYMPSRTGDSVKLALIHLAIIQGVVLDKKRPAGGIKVETDLDDLTFTTDDQGRFTISHLAAGPVTIFAGNADKSRGASVSIEAAPGVNEVELEMGVLCDLEVRLTYPDGQPAEDVLVDWASDGNFDDRGGAGEPTNKKGEVLIEWLEPGELFLHVEEEIERQPITVCKNGRHDVTTLVIGKEPGIMGTVTGEDRRPIDAVYIRVKPNSTRAKDDDDYEDDAQQIAGNTHADGRYRIPRVGAGKWTVSAEKRGFRSKTVEISRTGHEPDSTVDFVLERGGVIRGHVVDRANAPQAGWIVRADGLGEAEAQSRADGSFELGGLDDGIEYTLRASGEGGLAGGSLRSLGYTEAVSAKAGDEAVVLVAMEPKEVAKAPASPSEDTKITGRVIDALTKAPIERAGVMLSSRQRSIHHGFRPGPPEDTQPTFQRPIFDERRTSPSGSFQFEHIPAGDYTLAVRAEERVPVTKVVTAKEGASDDDAIVIELDHGVEISGTVQIAGAESNGLSVVCRSLDRQYQSGAELDDDGGYKCRVPSPGTYYVDANLYKGMGRSETEIHRIVKVDVPEQGVRDVAVAIAVGQADVVISFPPLGAGLNPNFSLQIILLATNTTGSPIDRAMGLLSEGTYYRTEGEFAGSQARIRHVGPGPFTLFVDPFFSTSGPAPWTRAINVPAGGELKITPPPEPPKSQRPLFGPP